MREKVTNARRWVVKIGSALLTGDGRGLDQDAMRIWVEQLVALRNSGADLVLVSSGAVAAGMSRLGWSERPKTIHELQAAAAIGQMGLVQAWESSFQAHGLATAQVLLTHDDLSDRKRYLNARSTLRALLDLGVIPVVNENDTVVTDEIRFGDNDTLGALVTNLVEADLLVILTDKDGLYTADPGRDPNAELIAEAMADDARLDAMAGGSAGALGRGGMLTKLRAARLAARSGAGTVIVGGRIERVIDRLHAGEPLGTLLLPEKGLLAARKQWLAGHLQIRGRLFVDAGAVRALTSGRRSLLPVGVTAVEGSFRRGEMVACVGPDGREVARGLVNYGIQDAQRIVGQPTESISSILGYIDEPELVHRDNLVLL
ncbi:MAG: glutamate 5-kinase [Pseudomonadaceae bacterium]|nr:MAG: glutamate 5-kinase [Pseudomonadaceae bacterium]